MERHELEIQEEKAREDLLKLLRQGKELIFNIDGEEKTIFWKSTGHGSRIYYKSYFRKKINEMVKLGLLDVFSEKEEHRAETPKKIFYLKHRSVLPETVKILAEKTPIPREEYDINTDVGAIVFSKDGSGEFKVSYDYYDEEAFNEIYDVTTTSMMIYLSAKKVDNHNESYFDAVDDVFSLGSETVNDILSSYLDEIRVSEDDIKKLQTPLSTELEEISEKDSE